MIYVGLTKKQENASLVRNKEEITTSSGPIANIDCTLHAYYGYQTMEPPKITL